MGFKVKIKKWHEYSKIADLPIIARRKFFNNCFDGALTSAGIISGFFVFFLMNSSSNTPNTIIITGFATALAIGVSGLWGAFLSEEAERKKKMIDLKKEMAILEEKRDIGKKNQKLQKKSLIEKAEDFATIVASLVDGAAPVLGAALPLIPFLFGTSLDLNHFIFSYTILLGLLIYLGFFLGKISGGGKVRYAIHLVIAGIVTLVLSLLLGSISG